jgi:hypothetical protein
MKDVYYFQDWVSYMLNCSDYSELELLEYEEYYENLSDNDENLENFVTHKEQTT